MGIKKVKNAIRNARANNEYLKYYDAPIDDKAILLEAAQGKHTDGNIFAFLRCVEENPRWQYLTPYVVITRESKAEAQKKFARYGFKRAKLVVRNSTEYMKILATAKYLITDNSFPPYFIKKSGQVYLNTWHGTPLKRLGRADITNSTSIGNVQKNFLTADYLLQPNSYTKEVMMKDYMVDRVYGGRVVVADYPRNDVLFTKPLEVELRTKFNPNGKKIIAYMPTWRGTGRNANVKQQINEAEEIIRSIEKSLSENEMLYVNFHFLIGNQIDFSQFEKVRAFPAEYETYDFLAICDCLISDYSSVIMDFAQTGKDVIMYMYDYEEYLSQKGFYFDIRKLPFKQAYNMEELVEAIHSKFTGYQLDKAFVGNDFGCATERMMEMLTAHHEDDNNANIEPRALFTYMGNAGVDEIRYLSREYITSLSDEEKKKTVLGFEGDMKNRSVVEFLNDLDMDIEFIMFMDGGPIEFKEYVTLNLYKNHGMFKRSADRYCQREFERLFSHLRCERIRMYSSNIIERFGALAKSDGKTEVCRIPMYFYRRPADAFYRHPETREEIFRKYDHIVDFERDYGIDYWNEKECQGIYSKFTGLKIDSGKDRTAITGKLVIRTENDQAELCDTVQIGARIQEEIFEYPITYSNFTKHKRNCLTEIRCSFKFEVSNRQFNRWYTNNLVRIKLNISGSIVPVRVLVSGSRNPLRKRVYDIVNTDYVCEIKEASKYLRLVIRNRNVTDNKGQQLKLWLAFFCHILTPWHKPILLFEKNSSRYEESGAILYEKMIDIGYRNVLFILSKDYEHRNEISDKYMKHIVDRFSFAHYYNMFAAKTIISTETLGHALEKGATNWFFKNFVLDGSKNYVFLQHGVMYMISLNSEQRDFFKKGKGKGKQRVVVSSRLEATHFTDNTEYEPEDMYICGLIKFDRSVLNENADKIVVMLTWRPWEYVSGINDIKETGCYKMLREIVECVPENLRDKLIVLPHPLIEEQVKQDAEDFVWEYYRPGVKYDDILKEAKLFISDYSSITYDAFYRGTNVIFYWKEKDECIREYGENSRLMLTEELAFGNVCYDRSTLEDIIPRAYAGQQKPEYIENYGLIVEHHDGKNAERFIEMAKEDGIL